MTNKEIGNRIREVREARGYTKSEVAAKIKVADSTIKRYEDGDIEKIKIPVIESIAKVLDVNPLWLIGKSENKEEMKKQPDFQLQDAYFNFAKEMQEKNISVEDMQKLWDFYQQIKNI